MIRTAASPMGFYESNWPYLNSYKNCKEILWKNNANFEKEKPKTKYFQSKAETYYTVEHEK